MRKVIAFIESVLGIAIGLLFLLVLFQVIARVVFSWPTSWSVELGRTFFAVIIFYGAAVLVYDDKHMKVTALLEKLPSKARKFVSIINNILIILFLGYFTFGSFGRAIRNFYVKIPTLEWMTTGYLYLIVMGGGAFMMLFTIRRLLKTIKGEF